MIQYNNKKHLSFLILQSRVEDALPDNMTQLVASFICMLDEMSPYVDHFKEELKKEYIRLRHNSSNETQSDNREIESVATNCGGDLGDVIDQDCNKNISETTKQKCFSRLTLKKSIERTYTDDSLVSLTTDGARSRGNSILNHKFKFK